MIRGLRAHPVTACHFSEENQDARDYSRKCLLNDGRQPSGRALLRLGRHPSEAGLCRASDVVQLRGDGVQDQTSLTPIAGGRLGQAQARPASSEAAAADPSCVRQEGPAVQEGDLGPSDELPEGSCADAEPQLLHRGWLESRPKPTSAASAASSNAASSLTSTEDGEDEEAPQVEPGAATAEEEDISEASASSSSSSSITADVPAIDRGYHPSNGSVAHMTGTCSPCSFVASKKGCSNGEDCAACHYSHPELTVRSKPCKWKRERYRIFEERAVARIQADPQSFDLDELNVPTWIQRDDRMHSKLMKALAEALDEAEEQHSRSLLPESCTAAVSGSTRPRQFIRLTRLSF